MSTVVELWSNLQCVNGATHLRTLGELVSLTYGESLQGDIGATLVLPLSSTDLTDATVRRVIRIEDEGVVTEYRILRIDTDRGAGTATITCSPIQQDLGRAPLVQFTNGIATYAQAATTLTPTQWIDNYVLPALTVVGITWVTRGTVTPTGAVTLSWSETTPLALLRQLVQNTDYEVYLRRNGSTDYKIDLVTIDKSNGINAVAFVGRNVRTLRRTADGDLQATSVIPQGVTPSGGTRPSGIEQVQLQVHTEPSASPVKVKEPMTGGKPILVDDALNGFKASVVTPTWYPGNVMDGMLPMATPSTVQVSWYNSVSDAVNAAWADSGRCIRVAKYDKRSGELLTLSSTHTTGGTYAPFVQGFSPTGTAGFVLSFGTEYVADADAAYLYITNLDTGTTTRYSTPDGYRWLVAGAYNQYAKANAVWVGGSYNAWYVAIHRYDGTPTYVDSRVAKITTGGTITTYAPPAAGLGVTYGWCPPPCYVSGSSKLLWNTQPHATAASVEWYFYDLATNTWDATVVTRSLADTIASGSFYDPTTDRVWVTGAVYYGNLDATGLLCYNPTSNALDTSGGTLSGANRNWQSKCLNPDFGHFVKDGTDLYICCANTSGTNTPAYRRKFSLTNKSYTSEAIIHPSITVRSTGNLAMWYDSTLGGWWHHLAGGTYAWQFLKDGTEAPAGTLRDITIADSVTDDGSGVSTLSFSGNDWRFLKGPKWTAGKPRFMLKDASDRFLYEVPDAGAVATYGQIKAFLDGSVYGYRGEMNCVLSSPDFADTVTLSAVAQPPGILRLATVQGASGHPIPIVVDVADYPTSGSAAGSLSALTNGAKTTQYLIDIDGLAAGVVIPVGTQVIFSGNGNSYYTTTKVTTNGSGQATLDLHTTVSVSDNITTTLYRPTLPTTLALTNTSGKAYPLCGGAWYPATSHCFPVWLPQGLGTSVVAKVWFSYAPKATGSGQYTYNPYLFTVSLGHHPFGSDIIAVTQGSPNTAYSDAIPRAYSLSASATLAGLATAGRMAYLTIYNNTSAPCFVHGVAVYILPSDEAAAIGFWSSSAANALWNYGIRAVADYAQVPLAYQCEVLEDDTAAPFALGGTVILRDPSFGVAATPRVVGLQRTVDRNGRMLTVELDNRSQSLVRGLVKKGSV